MRWSRALRLRGLFFGLLACLSFQLWADASWSHERHAVATIAALEAAQTEELPCHSATPVADASGPHQPDSEHAACGDCSLCGSCHLSLSFLAPAVPTFYLGPLQGIAMPAIVRAGLHWPPPIEPPRA